MTRVKRVTNQKTGLERPIMIRIIPTVAALSALISAVSLGGCSSSSGGAPPLTRAIDAAGVDENPGAPTSESESGVSGNEADPEIETESESETTTEPEQDENQTVCELASARTACDACLSNFCHADCVECSGAGTAGTDCDLSYACVAETCANPEEETDLACVVDCASDDDSSARRLYALIDCGRLNCPGYCYF